MIREKLALYSGRRDEEPNIRLPAQIAAELFIRTLQSRLPDLDKESKRKRVEKVIQKAARQGGA